MPSIICAVAFFHSYVFMLTSIVEAFENKHFYE